MPRYRREPEPISERERIQAYRELNDARDKAVAAYDHLRKTEQEEAEQARELAEARKARKGLFRRREQ